VEVHRIGLVGVRHIGLEVAGHSLAEADSRPEEGTAGSALEVVVDSSLVEEADRILGVGELEVINICSTR
jgi:hypothetical protein